MSGSVHASHGSIVTDVPMARYPCLCYDIGHDVSANRFGMINAGDGPTIERVSYEERLSELLATGEPLEAYKLARRMLSQSARFRNPANAVLNDLHNLTHGFGIDDPEIENLFDPRWIRKVNIDQVFDAALVPFHGELRDALIDLGFVSDVAGDGNTDGAERLVITEAARAINVPVIEQMKTVVAHVVRKYLTQCGESGYPSAYLRDRFALRHFAHATRNGGHHTPHIHNNAMFVVAYYVDVPRGAETEIVFGGFARPGLPDLTSPPIATKRPATGDFIVFPGFHSHTTTPHHGPELRINMAFDVQPA
jgi:hypothetical protein